MRIEIINYKRMLLFGCIWSIICLDILEALHCISIHYRKIQIFPRQLDS